MSVPAIPSVTTTRQHSHHLVLILLVALLLRIGLVAAMYYNNGDLHTVHDGDTPTYLVPAESMVAHGTFAVGDTPEIYRTPAFPLLLAVGILAGHVELVTVVLQIMLSLASIALVYHLAWTLTTNSTVALAAGALAAAEPLSIVYTSFLMPETLFTFLLLASLSVLLHYLRTSSALALGAAALLLAAATYARPIVYYLPLLLMSLLAVRAAVGHGAIASSGVTSSGRRGRVFGCLAAIGFGVVALAPCVAWQVRNYVATGYSEFSGIPEGNLYFYQGASILAQQSGKTLRQVQIELGQNDERLIKLLHGPQQAATVRRLGAEGRRLLAAHPFVYAKIHARGTAILALDPGASDVLRVLGRYPNGVHGLQPLNHGIGETLSRMRREVPQVLYLSLALGAVLALVYCASALGLFAACHRLSWQWTTVIVTLAYLLLVSGGPTGVARLRTPMMPLVCILAGCGIATLLKHAWSKRHTSPRQLLSATNELQLTHAA